MYLLRWSARRRRVDRHGRAGVAVGAEHGQSDGDRLLPARAPALLPTSPAASTKLRGVRERCRILKMCPEL